MSGGLSKANGAEFVAIITSEDGTHRVECFLRRRSDIPGFPSEMKIIRNESDLPSFPPRSLEDARKLVTELAGSFGYTPSEIVWEDG
jgi:hypothetical protein